MTIKYLRLVVALVAGLQLAACYTDYGPVEVGTGVGPLSGANLATRLQPGERLKITVYGEESLTGEYDVNPSGYVTMPLVGSLRASGRSQSEFGKDIAARYQRGGFLQDPHVTVAVVQFKPFYVLGEATSPGEYSVQKRSKRTYRGCDGGWFYLPRQPNVRPYQARWRRGLEGIFSCRARANRARRFDPGARKVFLAGTGPSPPQDSRRDERILIFHDLPEGIPSKAGGAAASRRLDFYGVVSGVRCPDGRSNRLWVCYRGRRSTRYLSEQIAGKGSECDLGRRMVALSDYSSLFVIHR